MSEVLAAAADLATARIQLENRDPSEIYAPVIVDAEFLQDWANRSDISPEFRACAQQISTARTWETIESWAKPLPPEILEMKSSRNYQWVFPGPVADSHIQNSMECKPFIAPYRTSTPIVRDNTVGPSDMPDDMDEYQTETDWFD